MKVVVDSSGWIEFLGGFPKGGKVASHILKTEHLVVPVVVIYEVYKKIKKTAGEDEALKAVIQMEKGMVVPFGVSMALFAADLSLKHRLPMADAMVYAATLVSKAQLVTLDNDFKGLPFTMVL